MKQEKNAINLLARNEGPITRCLALAVRDLSWIPLAITVVCACALSNNSSLAADWTQFRGLNGAGVSPETGLPTQWSATEGLRWKAELPGRGVSNPVIAGGRVYVTASSGYKENRLHVLAFDAASGKKLWERSLWSTGQTQCHPKTCMAAPTPVTDGKAVYALFATTDLCAFDTDGNLLWYRSLVRDYPTITNQVGMAASPILYKDLVIVPMDNVGDSFLAGIDKKTGKNRWKAERPRDICWTTPVLLERGDRADVLFQGAAVLTAFDAESGRISWEFKAKGLQIPSPVLNKQNILVPGRDLLCIKPPVANETPEVLWKTNKLQTGFGTHLVYEDRVYAVNDAGVLHCADAADGKPVWQQRLQGPFDASAVGADGKIYLVNGEGTTFVVQTGKEPKILAKNELKDTILATPAIADGAIYLRSDKHLYCIGDKKKPG
ncbi:MAG: PQQ-binding-like beta-propeller repeat protein [Gemmataceae bacterium]